MATPSDREDCVYPVRVEPEGLKALEKALDPKRVLETGCRVIKHPNCCVLCAANNDCAKIPMHVRCFPAGTVVSGPRAVASVTRWYSGDLVEFETRSGAVLAATPNHPILTTQGWVGAGLLNQGDQVVREGRPHGLVVGDPGDYQEPALIEDVASSVGEGGTVLARCVPMTPMDLHGDGIGSKVAVVRTDGLLWNRDETTDIQPRRKPELGVGCVGKSMLTRLRLSALRFKRNSLATDRIVRRSRPGHALLRGTSRQHQSVGIRHAPVVGEVLDGAGDTLSADSVIRREGLDGLTGTVTLDQIVKVWRFPFSGHVYNFETVSGWYLANSIISANCRCRPEFYFQIDIIP